MTALRQIEIWVAAGTRDAGLRRELEKELAVLVISDSATYEARRFACAQLAVVGSEACLPALARLLKNEATVDIACLALANLPSERASEVLRDAAPRLKGNARLQVLKTLGTRRDPAACPLLARAVTEENPAVVETAILALGRIATPAALERLAVLRADARGSVAGAAREATMLAADRLAETGKRSEAEGLYMKLLGAEVAPGLRRGALIGLLHLDSDGGVGRIADVLDTEDAVLKPLAIAQVARLSARVTTTKFAARLPDLPPADQVLLIAALAERADPAARPAVSALLASSHPAVRWAATDALAQLGDASNVPGLCRLLVAAQTPPETRRVEMILSRLPGGETVDRALMVRLRDRMAGPKAPILAALVRRGNRAAMPTFMAEAGSGDVAMARLAFQGLDRLAVADDLPAILGALGGLQAPEAQADAEASVARALQRLVSSARRSELLRAALDQAVTPKARCAFVRLLPVAGDKAALTAVEAALGNPETREAALDALADWPNCTVWDTLLGRYRAAPTEGEAVRVWRGLVRLAGEDNAQPTTEAIDRYGQLLTAARSDADRKAVLGVLGDCHDVRALRLAIDQLGNAGVQAEAAAAVRAIAEAVRARESQAAQAALDRLK
jgi:HEAT repeat protein/uncharacterized cupin superfamily protein